MTQHRPLAAAVLAIVAVACGSSPQSAPASGGSAGSGGASGASGGSANTSGTSAGGAGASGAGSGGAAGGSAGQAGGGTGGSGGGTVQNPYAQDAAFCAAQLDSVATQFESFRTAYTVPSQIPRSYDGTVELVGPPDWTSGFPAGSFWLLYEHTQDQAYRDAAEAFTEALYGQRLNTGTHDLGFMLMSSYGNGYRLTQDEGYATVLQEAAQSLGTRFNANVGATRSWDWNNGGAWQFPVIVDNMMNLDLFYRATELGGNADFEDMAVSHAETTLANHFRLDGSSYHLVDYDAANGSVRGKYTVQGLDDESAWARGQTWGLYGFTMSFRESQDQRFLAQAKKIADYYTGLSLMPEDNVPYFDFDAPGREDVPDHRDSSAGAIAASALFELAQYVTSQDADSYRAFAIKAVRSLSSAEYLAAPGTNGHFLLKHAVGHYPAGSEIDVAINYADYYYIEALMRCARLADGVAGI